MASSLQDFFQALFPGGRKSDPTYPMYTQIMSPGQPVYTPRDFANLAKFGYEKNVIVFRGISLIAESCGGIPWKLRKKGNNKRFILEHPLLDLLSAPNPRHGLGTFIEEAVSFWILSGNSYIYAIRPNKRSTPTELWNMRPDRMKVVPGLKQIDAYEYNLEGQKDLFAAENVLHLKMFSATNDWYGLSPVAVAAALVDQNNEGADWNTALLQNAGRPSGALVASGTLGNDQYERLKRVIREKYVGKKNAGMPMLLEGGLDWKQFSMSPLELDWMESRRQNMRDISIALGVPPELLGDSSNKTYSNYAEARKSFYQETILPLMDRLRDRLNMWLVPMFDPTLELDYDKEQVEALQEDRDSLNTRVMAQWNAGVVTLNEVRNLLGFSEIVYGDIFKLSTLNTAYIPEDSMQKFSDALLKQLIPPAQPAAPPPPADTPPIEDPDQQTKSMIATVPEPSIRSIKRMLVNQREEMLKRVRKASLPATTIDRAILGIQTKNIEKPLLRLMNTAGSSGYHAANESIQLYKKDEVEDSISVWNEAMLRYSEEEAAKRIVAISDTMREEVKQLLVSGIAQGDDVEMLSNRLQAFLSDEKLACKAKLIAQTEWTAAYNFGGRVAAISSGVPLKKQWITKKDAHTRRSHGEVDGQTTDLYEPFIVEGESLMYPGDTSNGASVKNIANCRCEQNFVIERKSVNVEEIQNVLDKTERALSKKENYRQFRDQIEE